MNINQLPIYKVLSLILLLSRAVYAQGGNSYKPQCCKEFFRHSRRVYALDPSTDIISRYDNPDTLCDLNNENLITTPYAFYAGFKDLGTNPSGNHLEALQYNFYFNPIKIHNIVNRYSKFDNLLYRTFVGDPFSYANHTFFQNERCYLREFDFDYQVEIESKFLEN